MSIWDKPVQADGKLSELEGYTFEVTGAEIRDGIKTQYGEKSAADLHVEIDGTGYVFSGFSAGIVAQVRNATEADFPFFATVEKITVKNGTTLNLVPVSEGEGDPLPAPEPRTLADAADDDIPF